MTGTRSRELRALSADSRESAGEKKQKKTAVGPNEVVFTTYMVLQVSKRLFWLRG